MQFSTAFEADHGSAIDAALGGAIRRITAPNPGPFTFHGTNSYLIGENRLTLVDPGPDSDAHLAALLAAIGECALETIVVTHTHVDHSALTGALQRQTGARVLGCAPHFAARALAEGETNLLDASGDKAYRPDEVLEDGARIATELGPLSVIATPGHTANHLCFALDQEGIVFSGDHVMAWSTSIVAPPDGAMAPYMASLERMLQRVDRLYLPGHGGAVTEPERFVRGLRNHRRMRATAILERLREGEQTIPEIVAQLYSGVDKRLHGAAALSVFAHLEELVERNNAATDGAPMLNGRYRVAE
jgi:glyoxylase-like metal-dependent hydrolase (beta-lactamase superfamily II)